MHIENNILRYYLRNVYFITGTAYAGKSTMVKMLSEKYGMIACGENYHNEITSKVAEEKYQPDLCYIPNLKDWKDFVTRPPEEYARWIFNTSKELEGFEVAELIRLSGENPEKKIIVDTNITIETLKEISDYNRIAIMISPQSMSVDQFFNRDDPEKQFILSVINSCENPEKVMENYKAGLSLINSQENYDMFVNSGLFTLIRENTTEDTKQEVLEKLAEHFGLVKEL